MDRKAVVKNKAVKQASGGFSVSGDASEVGATVLGQSHKDSVDSTFKEAIAHRATVEPGGLSKTDLRDVLRELIGDKTVRSAYTKVHGDQAVAAHVRDLRDWRARRSDSPYSSIRHLLDRDEDQ